MLISLTVLRVVITSDVKASSKVVAETGLLVVFHDFLNMIQNDDS